jgi:hypothetical protein
VEQGENEESDSSLRVAEDVPSTISKSWISRNRVQRELSGETLPNLSVPTNPRFQKKLSRALEL